MNLEELFRHEKNLQKLPAGQVLFKQGDSADLMYIVMSGKAEVIVHDRVVDEAKEGAMLGEMSMLQDGVRSATIRAKTDCEILPIERKKFVFYIQHVPEFALHIMLVLAERLRRTNDHLSNEIEHSIFSNQKLASEATSPSVLKRLYNFMNPKE
jgi:CRP-like cAMP-binding protein